LERDPVSVVVKVDSALNAAYIRLSENPVARTIEHNDLILVDVDELGVAVGIEVLDEGAALPFSELVSDYHVHSDVVDLLRLIRPDVASFLRLTTQTEGQSDVQAPPQLVAV
jgi:uncharacterized protein YuzE